jgi:hypothetical protein
MADDVATLSTKINTTEEKIEKLERHIANNDFEGTPYDDRAEAKAALKDLRAKEADLRRLLILDKEKEASEQRQTGAGTPMPPVRHENLICPSQRSCCIH